MLQPLKILDHSRSLELYNSLAARAHRKFGWKRPHRGKLLIILSFIETKQTNLADICSLWTRINFVNFIRIEQGIRPLEAIILVKFHFFKFWDCKPTPLNRSRWNLAREADLTDKFHLDRCNVSPLRGEKPPNQHVILLVKIHANGTVIIEVISFKILGPILSSCQRQGMYCFLRTSLYQEFQLDLWV